MARLTWPALISLCGAVGTWLVRGAIEEWVFSSLTEELQGNAWIIGDFIAWNWSPLVLGFVLFGGIYAAARISDKGRRLELSAGESAIKVTETASVKVIEAAENGQSTAAKPDFKNVTITPDDDEKWIWLRIDNNGPTGKFKVSMELLDTGEKEHSYHPPWRDGNVRVLEIVKGDKGTVNVAEIDHNPRVLLFQEQVDAVARGEVAVKFYTTANSSGEFYKTFSVPSTAHCRITVFHVEHGPVTPPRNYVLEIEAVDQLRFFERVDMEQEKQPDFGADRTYIGEGIWHEVKWRGFRLPTGRIHAEGPLCIDDDTTLLYRTHTLGGSQVKDYHEVAPPESHLYCPGCEIEYFLGATEKKAQRVGDARRNVAWRLGGGRTKLEELMDSTGLL